MLEKQITLRHKTCELAVLLTWGDSAAMVQKKGETDMLKRPTYQIEQEAERVLMESGQLFCAPVDLVALSRFLGIGLKTVEFTDDTSGMIRKEGEQYVVYCNRMEPRGRRNFTAAHELGHYFLHKPILDAKTLFIDPKDNFAFYRRRVDEAKKGWDTDKIREVEANQFAAALLMPDPLIRLYMQDNKSELEMAYLFQVSLPAMQYRLKNLGLTV